VLTNRRSTNQKRNGQRRWHEENSLEYTPALVLQMGQKDEKNEVEVDSIRGRKSAARKKIKRKEALAGKKGEAPAHLKLGETVSRTG